MTAPRPPRPATRSCTPVWSVVATTAASRRISPAGPMHRAPIFSPKRRRSAARVGEVSNPRSSGASRKLALSAVTCRMRGCGSSGASSSTTALRPRRARLLPAEPPTLASLQPPVRGLLPPTDSLPAVVRPVSASRPEAKISRFCRPRASQAGWTSASRCAGDEGPPAQAQLGRGAGLPVDRARTGVHPQDVVHPGTCPGFSRRGSPWRSSSSSRARQTSSSTSTPRWAASSSSRASISPGR